MHNKLIYLLMMFIGGGFSGFIILNNFIKIVDKEDISNNGITVLNEYVLVNFNIGLITSLIIALLAFSLFGIFIYGLFMFYKGFILSFNILALVNIYHLKAVYMIPLTLLIQSLLEISAYLLIMIVGIKISMLIINACINGHKFKFKKLINQLLTKLLLACLLLFIAYLIQGFINTQVVKYML